VGKLAYVTGTNDHSFLAVQKFSVVPINPVEHFRVTFNRRLELFPVPRILEPLVLNVLAN